MMLKYANQVILTLHIKYHEYNMFYQLDNTYRHKQNKGKCV